MRYYRSECLLTGWSDYIHPEGSRVFYNEEKVSPIGPSFWQLLNLDFQRVFTDSNLYDPNILTQLERYAKDLYNFLGIVQETLDEDVDVVFDLHPADPHDEDTSTRYDCKYYLVKHSTRTVFWLDDYDASEFPLWGEVLGVVSHSQVRKSAPFSCCLSKAKHKDAMQIT